MSQGFKLRYDQMREGDPTRSDSDNAAEQYDTIYRGASHVRSLCLIWPEGRRMFFNYAYLVSGEFLNKGDINIIRLEFSNYMVLLQGFSLEILFMTILEHVPRIVVLTDLRYALNNPDDGAIVTDIQVEKKNE